MKLKELVDKFTKFHAIIYILNLWFIRNIRVISNQKAKQLGLRHFRNVYGDEINILNCRSIWLDDKQRQYRVSHFEELW